MAAPSALDMSLDDIISKTRDVRQNGKRFSARGGRQRNDVPLGRSSRGPRSVTVYKVRSDGGRRFQNNRRYAAPRNFLKVENIDFSIMKEDLQELFASIGPIQKCWVDYDRTDRSNGTGGVLFVDEDDAHRAIRTYNGRSIEGKPLRLTFDVLTRRY